MSIVHRSALKDTLERCAPNQGGRSRVWVGGGAVTGLSHGGRIADRIKEIEQIDAMCFLTHVLSSIPSEMAIQGDIGARSPSASFARQHVPWDEAAMPLEHTAAKSELSFLATNA